LLLKHKADPNIGNMDKNLPLHYLARRVVEMIPATPKRKRGSDVDTVYVRVMKLMGEYGADVNAANINGETPLHQAASAGNDEAVRLLLKMKANPHLKNRYYLILDLITDKFVGTRKLLICARCEKIKRLLWRF
jgi:ankyrin repeat protein